MFAGAWLLVGVITSSNGAWWLAQQIAGQWWGQQIALSTAAIRLLPTHAHPSHPATGTHPTPGLTASSAAAV